MMSGDCARDAKRSPYARATARWIGYAALGSAFVVLLAVWTSARWNIGAALYLLVAVWAVAIGVAVVVIVRIVARLLSLEAKTAAERDALAEELRAAHEALQRQQQALVQTEKMVAMGKMAAGVAHEIANPLASMDSVLQLAQRRTATSCRTEGFLDCPEMVDALREQVGRIDRIVRELTSFAHPNGEHHRVVPLCDLIKQSLDVLRFDHRVREVDVQCECRTEDGNCEVRVIPQQMHQVLVNLVLNGLDAMADTENPRLVIRTRSTNGWHTIEVADNGPGIKPEHLGRVFEPFFTTKPPGCGTGLGLSICATIVQQHGGRLSVDASPGKGAVFSIVLPAAQRRPSVSYPVCENRKKA